MGYSGVENRDIRKIRYDSVATTTPNMNSIPCWSLAALLGVIPNYKLISKHNYHTCIAETHFGKETVAWFDNPVDACYEIIVKLHNKFNYDFKKTTRALPSRAAR